MSWRYYAILCDARHGSNLDIDTLAFVDRTRSTSQWWTSDDPGLVLKFRTEHAAQRVCSRFKHNNPRVVDFNEAYQAIAEQQQPILRAAVENLGNDLMDPVAESQDNGPW